MKKSYLLLFICFSLALIVTSCTAQQKASRWKEDVKIADVPDDICIIDGVPKILGINIEQDDDIALLYINTKGNVVAKLYGDKSQWISTAVVESGSLYFEGDLCDLRR